MKPTVLLPAARRSSLMRLMMDANIGAEAEVPPLQYVLSYMCEGRDCRLTKTYLRYHIWHLLTSMLSPLALTSGYALPMRLYTPPRLSRKVALSSVVSSG